MELGREPFLKVRNIQKQFGHVKALRGVSVQAYQGEVLAIVGDNGAGKSTLIKILSGVLEPDEGEIEIDGKTYRTLTPRIEEAEKLLESLEIQIPDVTVPVGNLSGGQRQGVAVARLVHNGGKLLIFDEPTAAMGLNESNAVLRLIRKLAADGYAVIIISHNLPQVFHISDRICVMRQGQVMKELLTKETTMDEVVSLITGAISVE